MKAIVLAGGFAKRMWPLTKEKPKHLLPVAGKPMLDYVIDKLDEIPLIDRIYISTNAKFKDQFNEYLGKKQTKSELVLFIEDSKAEDEKLGSVGALGYLINENEIDDELLVVGGDNIFNFSMSDFIGYFEKVENNIVALFDLKSISKAKLYGVVELDEQGIVKDFQEKPESPRSTLISTACYLFTKTGTRCINQYLSEGNDPDKIGHFIEWLYKYDTMYGFVFSGYWFDIGSFESYNEANDYFLKSE